MLNKILLFLLIAFTLSACENNFYQVDELKEATVKLSSGDLPADFKYPKNMLYIDSLRIRIAPCKDSDRCSEGGVSELISLAETYINSTFSYTETIFPVKSPGNTRLESNYMNLYQTAKELATNNGTTLKLTAEQTETIEHAYAAWKKRQQSP